MYALLPLPRAQASGLRLGAVGEGCAGGGRGGVRDARGSKEEGGGKEGSGSEEGQVSEWVSALSWRPEKRWPQPSLALTLSCPSFPRHLHTFSLLRDPCPSDPPLAPASRPCIHPHLTVMEPGHASTSCPSFPGGCTTPQVPSLTMAICPSTTARHSLTMKSMLDMPMRWLMMLTGMPS